VCKGGSGVDTENLVKKASRGDEEAFTLLLEEHKAKLYRIAYAHFKNEQDSLEALQETVYRAFKGIRKLKEPQYFSTWITRILLNYCTDELKRKGRNTPVEEVYSAEYSSSVGMDDTGIVIRMAVERLQPQWKQLIILKYYEDLTISQISQMLNWPDGTVKTRLSRAIQELRKLVGKGEEQDA
jgi:RNA polymerase sigma-70 factor (TIGR02954 family)